MPGYRLCRIKTAKNPFFLENVGVNIYSLEELCYFFMENVPLIDATVMNKRLTGWVANELGLARLALKMEHAMTRKNSIMDFVTTVFREIGYFSQSELVRFTDSMREFLDLPAPLRLKTKGDSLCRAGKYIAAARVYRQIIDESAAGKFQGAFLGCVWYNRGVAEIKLMLFEEALSSFKKAMNLNPTRNHVKSYVEALGITRPKEKYKEEIAELIGFLRENASKIDFGENVIPEAEEVLEVVRGGIKTEMPKDLYGYVQELVKGYHASTGV